MALLYSVGGNINQVHSTCKHCVNKVNTLEKSLSVYQKVKHTPAVQPRCYTPRIYPKENKSLCSLKATKWSSVYRGFQQLHFQQAKSYKPKYPSIGECNETLLSNRKE